MTARAHPAPEGPLMTSPALAAADRRAAEEAAFAPPAQVQATCYLVSCLPEGQEDRYLFALQVEYRGSSRWAVTRHGKCLNRDGTWDWESRPSEREDEWLAEHRFDLDTAMTLAKAAAPLVTVNGFTVADVLRRQEDRPAEAGPA